MGVPTDKQYFIFQVKCMGSKPTNQLKQPKTTVLTDQECSLFSKMNEFKN